jgi:broad specificity phosphatase PhoE
MRLIILRHAESKKNLKNTIGGPGAPLTARGRRCSRRTASRIRSRVQVPSHIYCAPTVQTLATGRFINGLLPRCELTSTPLLTPIRLGRLSGSSIADAQRTSARDLQALEAWNRGAIDIAELSIGGMQSPWDFYRSGLLLLVRIGETTRCACVVATRSNLILLWHIKKRNTPNPGGGYTNVPFSYHRPATLNFSVQDFIWIRRQLRRNGASPSSVS